MAQGPVALAPGSLLPLGPRRACRLREQMHCGPRSRVWRALLLPEGRNAVIKVSMWRPAVLSCSQRFTLARQARGRPAKHPVVKQTACQHSNICPGAWPQVLDASSPQRMQAALQEQRIMEQVAVGVRAADSGTHRGQAQQGLDSGYSHLPRLLCAWLAEAAAPGSSDEPALCVFLAMATLHETAAFVAHKVGRRGRHGLPLDAVRGMARGALAALDVLHTEQRVVHRDVKPSNIALATPGVVRRGGAQGSRISVSREGLCRARWALLDLGSAAPLVRVWRSAWPWAPHPLALLPRPQLEAAEGAAPYETPAYSPPEVRMRGMW